MEIWKSTVELLSYWPLQIGIILCGALLVNIIQHLVLWRFRRRVQPDVRPWLAGILQALPSPLDVFIWICGAAWSIRIAHNNLEWDFAAAIIPLTSLAMVITIMWFGLRATRCIKQNLLARATAEGKRFDVTTASAITGIVIVLIVTVSIIIGLQVFGISINGLLTFGGLGALAVGMAAQGTLANFFGGWMIYMTRPFSMGDWISSPDRELQGTVEKIGWLQTRIRAFDSRPLYVPNSIFNTIIVVNPSRMIQRRIYAILGVRHVDIKSLKKIVTDVEHYLQSHKEVDQEQSILVYFDEMNLNQLNFFIWCFTRSTAWADYQRVKQDILLKVGDIIESHGARIGEPTTTVSLTRDWQEMIETTTKAGQGNNRKSTD